MAVSPDLHATIREVLAASPVLVGKVGAALDVDRAGAERAIVEVVRFLVLTVESSERLTPSVRVDLAWHELILCTRAYAELCERLFGRFVHHEPGGEGRVDELAFARTLARYRARFGPPDAGLWGVAAACGACEAQVITEAACTSSRP